MERNVGRRNGEDEWRKIENVETGGRKEEVGQRCKENKRQESRGVCLTLNLVHFVQARF